jgi:hypothetical protein
MAISVLDVRDTFAVPRVRVPAVAAVGTTRTTVRRLPATIAAAGAIGVLEGIGLLAVALTGLDGVLTSPVHPAGWLVAGGLGMLAAWIVLSAGSGAAMLDGAGRKLLVGLSCTELVLISFLLVIATAFSMPNPTSLPLPALGLLALAVPVAKLLLVSAPSAQQWVLDGPRTRVRHVDPVQAHRMLATVTLAVLGLSLGALALLAPVQGGGASDPASAVFTQD